MAKHAKDDDERERKSPGGPGGIQQRILSIVTVIIVLVWVASFIGDILIAEYDPPTGINQVMMVLAGFLFAGRQASKKDEG